MSPSRSLSRALARARVDWTPVPEPAPRARVIVVSLICLGAALGANAGLVTIATSWSPSLNGYSHFRFIDYGSLTALGEVGACAVWFVLARISSAPRWLFLRLAVVTTILLWVPDLWLIAKHEPVGAVATLMVMHLAMALLTYNILVRAAGAAATSPSSTVDGSVRDALPVVAFSRRTWPLMATAVGFEFLIGLGELFYVPYNRPDGWISVKGEAISLIHALAGGFLGIAAIAISLLAARQERLLRAAAWSGLSGVLLGAAGGILCYDHSLRLVGMGLMFVGATVAFFGYLVPLMGHSMPTPSARTTKDV